MEPMAMDDEDIIFSLAGECEELFSQIHSQLQASLFDVSNLLEEYQYRFTAWAAYLGVFAKKSICLDRRLIRHPELQDQVVRLLDILQLNLEQVSSFVAFVANGSTAFSTETEDGQTEDGQTDSQLAPELRAALEAIDGAIDRLNRVGIAIRRSSTRGSTCTLPNDGPGTLDCLEQTMLACVQALYPGARIELQEYLSQYMATRYRRIRSRQSRNKELQTRRAKPAPSLDTIPEGEGAHMDHQPSPTLLATTTLKQGETHINSVGISFDRQRTQRPHSEPSSINLSLVRQLMNAPSNISSQRKGTLSIQAKQVGYPKAPSAGSNPKFIICEWCFELIHKQDSEGSQWRTHVDKDFNPYICLSDSCSHPTRNFSKFRDWEGHMRSLHGKTWYRDIYLPSAWVCPVCLRGSTEFSTPEELDEHLREAHGFTDIQREAIVDQSRTDVQRDPETCPLCCLPVREDEVAVGDRSTRATGAEHAEPRKRPQPSPVPQSSLKRARTEIGGYHPLPNSSAEDTPSDREPNTAAAEADHAYIELISRHVATHLQTLMLLVIRFMDSQKDGDEINEYGSSTANSGDNLTRKTRSWDGSLPDEYVPEVEDVDCASVQDDPSVIITSSASDGWYNVPHYADVPVEEDRFLQAVIESGAFQSHQVKGIDLGILSSHRTPLSCPTRLLERDDTGEFRLTSSFPNDAIPEIPPYAILSHTWGNEEVLFEDLEDSAAKKKAGYAKIQFCGDQAKRDGLKYFWVDTCCIDKSDAAELQHSLNSTFEWYRNAAKCYVYLADVSARGPDADSNPNWELAFRKCRWFTRGWTLQELIAPAIVEFFSKEGVYLGDKKSLEQEIHDITGIPQKALQGSPLSDFGVVERMKWIEKRNTTLEEDNVYSLFGIFDVHIPVLYGEGKQNAFKRLQDKVHENCQSLAKLWSTDPRVEKKRIELAKGGLLADAYRWVLNNPDFNRWRHRPESRLLWIKGDPGKGKTMLLCGIIDELERPVIADGSTLAYFFCQATDSRINNATAVLRGLIYLLAQRQPRLLSHLPENTYASDDAMAWIVLSKTLLEMLEDPNLKVTYLVIDALDECIIDQQKLLSLIVQISSVSARIKWLVSSRNWVQIEKQLAIVTQQSRLSLELNAESVTSAVNAFIRYKVMYLSQLKQYDGTLENAVHYYLSSNADGTFLWVALVCQALANPNVRRWQTLNKLHAFPPGLDSLYARMIKYIDNSDDADLCKRILATATVVRRPVSLRELTALLEMPDDISDNPEYLEELIKLCGSFLSLREQTVYFIHQSAKDFLQGKAAHQASREAFYWVFPQGMEDVNHTVFSRSLNKMSTILQRDIYGLKAPGFPINKVQTPSPDPLATVRYSCVFWVDHLRDSISDKDTLQRNTLDTVQIFVEQKYLYWLEALSLIRAISEGTIAIRQLEGLLGCTGQSHLTSFVRDAHRFALSYRWIIEQAPLQAYISALIFTPACSLVKKKFKAEEPDWISTKPAVEADWNACLQTLEGHRYSVQSVAFSPDGQRLASGSGDNTVKIWDTASGQCLQTLKGHSDLVQSVAFSPDGQRLASGSDDNTVKIWDPASGQYLQTLEGHSDLVQSVAFSPDGQRLASGSHDNTIKIWDGASGQCLQTLEGHSSWVQSVAFSPDGQRLASGSDDNTVKIWDTASGQCLQTLEGHRSWVQSVAFSPDGQRLASGSDDKTVKIWDAASGQCLQTLEGHSSSVQSVAFSPDGQRLASGSHDNTVKIWDTASGHCLQTLEGHSSSVQSVAFSPDDQRLASGSHDNTIKIWDTASGQYLQTVEGHSSSVQSVAFSLDGQRLVSGSGDKTVKIWDAASGQCLQTLEGHSSSVQSVAFSPDGQRLASGSHDNTIKIWDGASGQCLQTLEGHSSWVQSVAFSPDGQRLASGSHDNTVKIWDTASGHCLQTLEGHSSSVQSVAFSPDGQRLASGSHDNTIKIWDTASGQYLQTLEGHSSSVQSVAFSPDGQRLASGSDDKTVKIWDPASGQCLQTLEGHSSWVNSVAFWLDDSRRYGYGLEEYETWIICNGRNVLWLPPEYRPFCSAVQDRMVSIGCTSGRIITIGFLYDV